MTVKSNYFNAAGVKKKNIKKKLTNKDWIYFRSIFLNYYNF